jgi:DNA ligase (NAD+)
MTDAEFVRAKDLRSAHGGEAFANFRNAAAGTLRAQDRAYGSSAGMPRCTTVDEIVAAVATLGTGRGRLGFAVDGAVVKADRRLGS